MGKKSASQVSSSSSGYRNWVLTENVPWPSVGLLPSSDTANFPSCGPAGERGPCVTPGPRTAGPVSAGRSRTPTIGIPVRSSVTDETASSRHGQLTAPYRFPHFFASSLVGSSRAANSPLPSGLYSFNQARFSFNSPALFIPSTTTDTSGNPRA